MSDPFYSCWLTTNRACNMRCAWCYAKDTGFGVGDEMPLEMAKQIVDLCAEGGVKGIILIGGESTVYTHILEVIRYCKEKQIRSTLVTNGLVLSDRARLQEYIDAGLDRVSLSLKAHDREAYHALTGVDGFDRALQAIENLVEAKLRFSVSTVLTGDNMPDFIDGLRAAKAHGAYSFGLSFCYNVCMNDDQTTHLEKNNPYRLARAFEDCYPALKEALDGTYFSLEQALPQCVWNEAFIEQLQRDRHVHSICQLMAGTGLLFDTEGYLIPCNALHTMRYGQLGVDFHDFSSLMAHRATPEVDHMFRLLRGAPDESCVTCVHASTCGGGCVTNWTNYSFDELKAMDPRKGEY